MNQIPIELAHVQSYASEDFVVTQSNEAAHRGVMAWPDWPQKMMALVGPESSGKTHLAHVWAARSHANFVTEDETTALLESDDWSLPCVVEDIEHWQGETLFHLYNALKASGCYVLFTSHVAPSQLQYGIRDVESRIATLPSLSLDIPDELLLEAVMRKAFADRQLKVDKTVVDYILKRVERSCAAVMQAVDLLDKASLAAQRPITLPLARTVLRY